jgi:HD-GYP domain-containing protein (c-di-GMP phosphodiesterase class II)
MNKKEQMHFNTNSFLLSISELLEYKEIELLNKKPHHIKRALFIALSIGKQLELTPKDMSELCSYVILANNGLNQAIIKNHTIDSAFALEVGQNNISVFEFSKENIDIIKYSKEMFNGSGIFGLKNSKIPILSQIISFSYLIENMFNADAYDIKNREDIKLFVAQNRGIIFSKQIADIFLAKSVNISFWLDLLCENSILEFIYTNIEDFTYQPTFEQVLDITSLIDKLVCTRVKESSKYIGRFRKICEVMTDFYDFDHKDKQTFLIASDLRNIGRLITPSTILDKTTQPNSDELEILKAETYQTKKALKNIVGFNDIVNLASNHGEAINGQGYPYGLSGANLSLKDRLMAVLNIYQETRENKSYKNANTHKDTIQYVKEIANKYSTIDITIIDDIENLLS